MARHLILAITLIGIAGLLNSPGQAMTPVRCDDQAARCNLCANRYGGAYPSVEATAFIALRRDMG